MKTDRALRNKSYKHKMKTIKRNIFQQIVSNNMNDLDDNVVVYEKGMQTGVSKGIYHKGKAKRLISRFMLFINKTKQLIQQIKTASNQTIINQHVTDLETAIYDRMPSVKNKKSSSLKDVYTKS